MGSCFFKESSSKYYTAEVLKAPWYVPNTAVRRDLTLRLLMSYIYGAPSKARNANVVYIWTYVWQR